MSRVRPIDGALDYALALRRELDDARRGHVTALLDGDGGAARALADDFREVARLAEDEAAQSARALVEARQELDVLRREAAATDRVLARERTALEIAARNMDAAMTRAEKAEAECVQLRAELAERTAECRRLQLRADTIRPANQLLGEELERVRAALRPLWPEDGEASAAALAVKTALALEGYRADAVDRDRAVGLEPVDEPEWVWGTVAPRRPWWLRWWVA